MKPSDIKLNSESIDYLVDGELSGAQRRELLLACERNPEKWRDVALAFIESQMLSEDLMHISKDAPETIALPEGGTRPDPSGDQLDTQLNPLAISEKPLSHSEYKVSAHASVPPNISAQGRWHVSWTTAAALLLAIGMGYGVGEVSNRFVGSGQIVEDRDPATPESDDGPVYMLVRDRSTGGLRPVEIPVANRADVAMDAWPLDDLLDSLRSQGYDVQYQQQMFPFELPSGRRMVLPIDDIRVNVKQYQ